MKSAYETYSKIKDNIAKVIVGCDGAVELLIITLFSGGHILIEDVPGTGKTMLVKALAKSLDLSFGRVQATPDLLPTDLTGVNYFNMKKSEFEFLKGPVFKDMLLADEVNRATPKTQSGLLESMEEKQVTVDGVSYALSEFYTVIATENPIESLGVYPLPEAQLDRFFVKTSMGKPTFENAGRILERFMNTDGLSKNSPLDTLSAVADREDLRGAICETGKVFVSPEVRDYILLICEECSKAQGVLSGISMRGAIALMKCAKGYAIINKRKFVTPDDVKKAAIPTLAHRLVLSSSLLVRKNAAEKIVQNVLDNVITPTEKQIK